MQKRLVCSCSLSLALVCSCSRSFAGKPSWFCSFSADETRRTHLLKMLGRIAERKKDIDEEIKQMTWEQKIRFDTKRSSHLCKKLWAHGSVIYSWCLKVQCNANRRNSWLFLHNGISTKRKPTYPWFTLGKGSPTV